MNEYSPTSWHSEGWPPCSAWMRSKMSCRTHPGESRELRAFWADSSLFNPSSGESRPATPKTVIAMDGENPAIRGAKTKARRSVSGEPVLF